MAHKTSLARSASGLARYYMDCGWWRHPRNVTLGLDAIGLYSCIVGACNEQATNGALPADHELVAAMVGLRASKVRKPLQQLVDAGRLERNGDQLHVVGFSDHNPTTEEIGDYIEERSRQGARGNHIRWHVNKGVSDPECEYCHHRSSDPPSDPVAIATANPEGVANSSHGMGWDGSTTQVVSPAGQEATRTDDDDGSKESLVIAVARARAERIRPGQTPTPQWLRSVANGLDAVACERLRRAGSTPAEIDQALDDTNDLDRIANPTRPKPTTTDEQRRPALKPVADLEQLTDQPKGDKRRNLDGIAAAREAAHRAGGEP